MNGAEDVENKAEDEPSISSNKGREVNQASEKNTAYGNTKPSNGDRGQASIGSTKPQASAEPVKAATPQLLPKELYQWCSLLTAESSNSLSQEEYYWTAPVERILTKLQLTKRALIGIVGAQGAGKSAAMHAIQRRLRPEWTGPRFTEPIVAVKVPETGVLVDALASLPEFQGEGYLHDNPVDYHTRWKVDDLLRRDLVLRHRITRFVYRMDDEENKLLKKELDGLMESPYANRYGPVSRHLIDLIPKRQLRELRREALYDAMGEKELIMIDLPDYPKHDRRLIARDLDDVQGLWNRLMTAGSNASFVVFLQKETFNRADHYFYGKMQLIDLAPLSPYELLEAYKRKWGGYEPFTEDALQYIARLSCGIFRRFKRYLGLALEVFAASGVGPSHLLDLDHVRDAIIEEEIMRDLGKDLEAIFRNEQQTERAIHLLKLIADQEEGISQKAAAEKLELNEMAVSRLARSLEEHGYIIRSTYVMEINPACGIGKVQDHEARIVW